MSDITAESAMPSHVDPMLKLAYLAPAVLEKLRIARVQPPVSVNHLALAADIPWGEQEFAVFEEIKLQ